MEPHRHCFWDGVYIASTPTGNGIPQFCSEECEEAAKPLIKVLKFLQQAGKKYNIQVA